MNARTTRIIWAVLSLFIVVMVISQIVIKSGSGYKTTVAIPYRTTKSLVFTGVFIRNEEVIPYSGGGVISYVYQDGSRIARNSVIARSYKSEADLLARLEIDSLTAKKESLENAQLLVGTDNSQLETFNKQAAEKHAQLVESVLDGDYDEARSIGDSFYNVLCKKQIIKGDVTDYSAEISDIEKQISILEAKISSPPTDITAGIPGYFVSEVDGYEGKLSADTITAEQVEQIVAQPLLASGKNLGKVIDGYTWELAGILETAPTFDIFEGSDVTLLVGAEGSPVAAVVSRVEKLDDGRSLFVFSSDILNERLASGRTAQLKLFMGDYSGIRIERSALRFNADGEQGVFVKKGTQIFFRKVDILYWEDDYVVADNSGKDGYVALYDTFVTEGKDLYDGKVID